MSPSGDRLGRVFANRQIRKGEKAAGGSGVYPRIQGGVAQLVRASDS